MQITNPNNLPESLVKAVTPDQERGLDPHRMSITDFVNPPMMRYLRHRHWGEMTERVDDRVWLMLGTAFHNWINRHTPNHSEVKIEYEFAGYTFVGVIDLIEGSILKDYKVTSVWSFLLGEKIEWEQQLNAYAWLALQKDIVIKELQIVAVLRDHVMSKAFREPDYPNSAVLVKTVPLWSPEKMEKYVQDRVETHLLREGRPIPCTPAERFHKDDSYAVKIPNVQKAKRVLPSESEALEWARKNIKGSYEIEHRKGDDTRCKFYCSVRSFCPDRDPKYNETQEVDDGREN